MRTAKEYVSQVPRLMAEWDIEKTTKVVLRQGDIVGNMCKHDYLV